MCKKFAEAGLVQWQNQLQQSLVKHGVVHCIRWMRIGTIIKLNNM